MPRSIEDAYRDRDLIQHQYPTLPLAYSAGGGRGSLVGPLNGGVRLGELVVIDTREFGALVAQVRSLDLVERPLGEIELELDTPLSDGTRLGVGRATPVVQLVAGDFEVLGTLTDGTFVRGAPRGGFSESIHRRASDDQEALVHDALADGRPTLVVGSVGSGSTPARLNAAGFSRHTFLCGQSGSGKTYATGVILERLRLGTDLPMIVLDPNSDHVHLGEVRDAAGGSPAGSDTDAEGYADISDEVLVARARGRGGELLAIHFSDLNLVAQALLLGLDPVADLDEFGTLRQALDALDAPYSVDDVATAVGDHPLGVRIANLGIASWGVWCRPGEQSLAELALSRPRCLVLDLGGLELPAERTLVSLAMLRLLWLTRERKEPVLLVVDEAHNVLPAHPSSALEAAATDVGISIAAEGRKFGLHLLVATQRPSKVHANVVTQCDNLVLLRVNSRTDIVDLCQTFSHVPAGLIDTASGFHLGEVLFAGPIANVPMVARIGGRISPEGGGDVPTDWAVRQPRATTDEAEERVS